MWLADKFTMEFLIPKIIFIHFKTSGLDFGTLPMIFLI